MTQAATIYMARTAGTAVDVLARLCEVEKHLRADADFNRSWTDGRRGSELPSSAEYISRRLQIAAERDRWADAVALAKTAMTAGHG